MRFDEGRDQRVGCPKGLIGRHRPYILSRQGRSGYRRRMHWLVMLTASVALAQDFHYEDAPVVEAAPFGGAEASDADVVSHQGRLGRTWLEYRDGTDVLFVQWGDDAPSEITTGTLARPTLTSCPGRVWLTWEQEHEGAWRIHAESAGVRLLVRSPGRSDINHDACAAGDALRLAWQTDVDGQFDIAVCDIDAAGAHVPTRVTDTDASDWRPSVTPTHLAWDTHLEDNDVLIAALSSNGGVVEASVPVALASTAGFEGRVDLLDDAQGRTWYLYEEGAEAWGRRYIGNWTKWNNITDRYGPLHRFRALHVGVVGGEVPPLPMPLFEAAEAREDQRPGAEWLGTYYERGRLA
ncbi:MAG: hypothetical protein KDA28_11745, partial [Phycisphaerales bacterium]|nr:hypothetical protein [Phycisphaerales bacterium]